MKVYCENCEGGKKSINYGCPVCGGKGYSSNPNKQSSLKVIYFVGYGDYDAVEFEKQNFNLKNLYEEIINGKSYIEGDYFSGDLYAYEFENVDPEFISFIKNKIQKGKNQVNFYII